MDRDEAAVIFRTYSKRLYNIALRITASVPESEEIMQETMIRYLTRGPRLESEARRSAWLRSTCIHMSIDWLRKSRKLVPLDKTAEEIPDSTYDESSAEPIWNDMDENDFREVMAVIESLPAGYRTVLVLRLIEGYEYSAIAQAMHITETGVRSQYMRARKKVTEIVMKKRRQDKEQ